MFATTPGDCWNCFSRRKKVTNNTNEKESVETVHDEEIITEKVEEKNQINEDASQTVLKETRDINRDRSSKKQLNGC